MLWEHVRHTARRLGRARSYTVLTVALLGLGLGTVAATFTALSRVLLDPLPVRDQDGVVVAWTNHTVRGADHYPVTAALFEAAERGGIPGLSSVAAVGSYGTGRLPVDGPDGPTPIASARVLGDFFGVLGAQPVLGRTLQPADDAPGAAVNVGVISHGLWVRLFGESPDVLGQVLNTRLGSITIVGVMPPDFDYPQGAELWAPTRPLYPTWESDPPRLELDLLGRLSEGATLSQVSDQMAGLSRSTPDLSGIYEGAVPVVRSFEEHVLGDLRPTLVILFLGGLLVLVVATLDVANMVLVRAASEQRHAAVRQALGLSSRWAAYEAVIEAFMLAVLGTVAAALIGAALLRLLIPLAPESLTRLHLVESLAPSAGLLIAVCAVLAVAAAVVFPRVQLNRALASRPLQWGARAGSTKSGNLLREAVVAGQIAVAVWVLVTGALLIRTVLNLQNLEAGFDPEGLSLVALDHPEGNLTTQTPEDAGLAAAVRRIEASDAVLAATPIQMGPLPGNGAWQTILFKEGQPRQEAFDENAFLFMEFVEPDFAAVLDVPLLRGRLLAETDDLASARVLMVNQAAARLYWPGEEAVGQQIGVGFSGYQDEPFTVVGVIGNTRYGDLTEIKPSVYFPILQIGQFRAKHILVRTTQPSTPVLALAREALQAEAPRYRALEVSSVMERLDEPLVRPRFAALLVGVLAFAALLISVAGVYSVMAFLVRTRRRDLGIRLACGGSPVDVGGDVVRRGLMIALVGSLIGAGAAVGTGELFRSLLFGVTAMDPQSLAAGVGFALVFAALACLVPAVSAAQTDPAIVLRAD